MRDQGESWIVSNATGIVTSYLWLSLCLYHLYHKAIQFIYHTHPPSECRDDRLNSNYMYSLLLQDGVHREVRSSDTTFQRKISENPTRHSRWVSSFLLDYTVTLWEKMRMRNLLSNSIIVIFHLKYARQLDRLCTPLFLTTETSCCRYDWIADGCRGPFLCRSLFLCHVSLPCWWCCCCRLELLRQEKTLLIFTPMPLCCSLQST